MTIARAGISQEREADRIAGEVMASVQRQTLPLVQRDCGAQGQVSGVAHSIANGHAWGHGRNYYDNKASFARLVHLVMTNATEAKGLQNNRHIYLRNAWVVITDPNNADGGTAIRKNARQAKSYYDRQV